MTGRNIFKLIPKAIGCMYCFLFANTLGRLAFSGSYFVGKWFKTWHSPGWRWVHSRFWSQKIGGANRAVPWPVSPRNIVSGSENIVFHPDDMNNFQGMGCYFQGIGGRIIIGRGTYIAPNVGIITANHDPEDLERHQGGQDVVLGKRCWIGMNSMILPGVHLGDGTIVGAGSVVTRSFPQGHCVIVGNPARLLRELPGKDEPAGE